MVISDIVLDSALERARKIVAELEVDRGDAVLEVGPGHGELTDLLAGEVERLVVVDSLEVKEPRTGALVGKLADLGFETGLIVTRELDENVYLASRNVPGVYTVDVAGVDPVSLVAADKVIMTVDAVKKIEEWLG